jgi:5-formyltetrahydrofolate cyclo-ligase
VLKSLLRKKILKKRDKNKSDVVINIKEIFKILKKEKIFSKNIGGYYPVNSEVNDMPILKELKKKKFRISLPVIKNEFKMDFYEWSFSSPLKINRYGIPEPISKKIVHPEVIFIPLVGFDKNLNRLGYGGGYYDRYLKKTNGRKKILKIGLAMEVQKIEKIPTDKYDQKLDYVVTNKNVIQ